MISEILLLAITILIFWTWLNSRSRRNLPPGPSLIIPFLGNIPQLTKYQSNSTSETFDKLVAHYGPLVYFQFGRLQILAVHDLDVAKELLNSEAWVDRGFDELIGLRSFGKPLGLIFGFGEMWKEIRKFTSKTLREFGFGKQQSMESVLEDEISTFIQTLDDFAVSGDDLSMRQFFTLSILNILWSMVAGVRFSHDDSRCKELIRLVDEASKNNPIKAEVIEALPFFWRLMKFSTKIKRRKETYVLFHQFFREILEERRDLGTYKHDPKDFIDVFLTEIDNQNKEAELNLFTDEQFMVVLYDLFIAGAETTSNTLEFAVLYMILNPRVQQKVQQEIDKVLGKNVRPTFINKALMPYTEATILEVQRMANVLPITFRGAVQDTKVSGYDIPKGTLAGVNLKSIHNSKEIWGDPENFRPERFLDAENKIINSNKIIPFGFGKRICLGESLARASLFSYFSSIMQRYNFTASQNHRKPTSKPVYGFSLSPEEYFVVVKHR